MRSAGLLALVLIAGCARSGSDLFKKLPDAPPPDAFMVAKPDASPPDAPPPPPDAPPADAM
jgi:hypothetical protein